MRKNDFVPRFRTYPPENLEKLGISSFSQRVVAMRSSKTKEYLDFYQAKVS
jgi:hypothetical protein